MLSNISQPQKDKYLMKYILHEIPRLVKFIDTENKMVVTRSWWGEREMGSCLMSIEFQFSKMKGVL